MTSNYSSNNSKKKVTRYTSPKGIAQYPWVIDADTKFDKDGQYHLQLDVNKDDARDMIVNLSKILNESLEEFQKEKGKKLNAVPFFEETDDGKVQFKFKQKKIISRKDGTRLEIKIPIFDAKGTPCSRDIKLGTGSTVKVSYSVMPYFNPTVKGVGLSLRLVAVQVINLVEYGSGGSAESYGFDSEEDGYTATSDDNPPFESDSSSEETENGDF